MTVITGQTSCYFFKCNIPAAVSAVLPSAAVPPITDSLQPHKILRGLALTPGTVNTPVSGLPKSNMISMSKCENSVPPALESNPTSHPHFQYFFRGRAQITRESSSLHVHSTLRPVHFKGPHISIFQSGPHPGQESILISNLPNQEGVY